jgi:lipopolysaccharide export system protein LptC
MEAGKTKTYSSPPRKLVKFCERSRNQWKAQAQAAKRVRKGVGTRLGRLDRSTAASQDQLAALHTQVAEWQAKHAQTARELADVKKKYPGM